MESKENILSHIHSKYPSCNVNNLNALYIGKTEFCPGIWKPVVIIIFHHFWNAIKPWSFSIQSVSETLKTKGKEKYIKKDQISGLRVYGILGQRTVSKSRLFTIPRLYSINQSIDQSINQSINQSVNQSMFICSIQCFLTAVLILIARKEINAEPRMITPNEYMLRYSLTMTGDNNRKLSSVAALLIGTSHNFV